MRQKKEKGKNNPLHLEFKNIVPKTKKQKLSMEEYQDRHLVLMGSAGTGKTFVPLYLGLRDVLEEKIYNRVIIIRSSVSVRDQGFLPGNDVEKMEVYEAPYEAIFSEIFGRGDAYSILKQKRVVEFQSTSFLRGTTIDNSVILVDEIQNMAASELNTIITRLGNNTKVIFAGDTKQSDMKKEPQNFMRFIEILDQMPDEFAKIVFTADDIVRSGLVKKYLTLKEKLDVNF